VDPNQSSRPAFPLSPVRAVDPGHAEGLEHHHDDQRQGGGVVVEHRHKVVPRALREQQADHEAQRTNRDWEHTNKQRAIKVNVGMGFEYLLNVTLKLRR